MNRDSDCDSDGSRLFNVHWLEGGKRGSGCPGGCGTAAGISIRPCERLPRGPGGGVVGGGQGAEGGKIEHHAARG